jgi:predicted dehydrogenase
LGVLGAGNYASAVFLPAVQKTGGVRLAGVASNAGLNARHAAQKYGFAFAASDEEEILGSTDINVVAVLTRHDQHARQVLRALRSGKHVYCEKPLAIHPDELAEIESVLAGEGLPLLTVGFNRRFAPLAKALKAALQRRSEPLAAHYRVNAGLLPLNHWTQDPTVGGGRIIGEGCHFIDFLTFLVGQAPIRVEAQALPDLTRYRQDNALLTLTYPDGSLGTLAYLANGDKTVAKERVEVFCGGTVAILDDFRRLEITANGRRQVSGSPLGQDKGHQAAWANFLACVRSGGPPPIAYEELIAVTRAGFTAVEKLAHG